MSSGKEDYLKAIYKLESQYTPVSNKLLTQELKISGASVSEMLVKLNKEGLIEYKAYKGSHLTEKGREEALQLIRFHRLWEVFLIDCLGYSWSESHEEAELLEHYTSGKMADRLAAYLGHPTHCPHGYIIPGENARTPKESLKVLANLKENDNAVIQKVREEKELLDYLQEKGIKIDMKVTLKKSEKYEGSLTLNTEYGEVSISHKAAMQIFVTECN